MNFDNIKKLRARLTSRSLPVKFDMDNWVTKPDVSGKGDECGTVGCLAGWTVLMEKEELTYISLRPGQLCAENIKGRGDEQSIAEKAAEILGLKTSDANQLFYRWCWPTVWLKGVQREVRDYPLDMRHLQKGDIELKWALSLLDFMIKHRRMPTDEDVPEFDTSGVQQENKGRG